MRRVAIKGVRRLLVGCLAIAMTGVVAYALMSPESERSVSIDEAASRLVSKPTTDGPLRPLVPSAGVYRYRGSGTETLSRPSTSQQQGPEMPGTVSHLDGACWRFRIDYSTKHHQHWDYCADGDRLVERGGASRQQLSIVVTDVDVGSETTCDDDVIAADRSSIPNEAAEQSCSATSTGSEGSVESSGTNRYVGREMLNVGGVRVETMHYRRQRTISGGQRGSETLDLWFAVDSGLPVKNLRSVTVVTPSPLGELTYTEKGSFELTSVEPAFESSASAGRR